MGSCNSEHCYCVRAILFNFLYEHCLYDQGMLHLYAAGWNQSLFSVDILYILQAKTLSLTRGYGTIKDVLLSFYGRNWKHIPQKEKRNGCQHGGSVHSCTCLVMTCFVKQ